METSNSIRFAGDVEFKELQIVSLNGQSANIINQVVTIEIYEDVFSSFTTLSIVLKESVDYINLFPFCGEEYVDINVDTPTMNKPIKGRFYIYKIADRIYTGEKEVAYTLKCISAEYLSDTNIKLNKAFEGNISEIASVLLSRDGLNTKKKINVDGTINRIKFTSNFWSPVKCLNYISTAAIAQNNSASFLFYENRDGFNFKNINNLLTAPTYQNFIKDNYTRNIDYMSLKTYRDVKEDYRRIIDLKIPVVTDYMRSIQSGQIKSKLITHDILTKKYKVKDYSVKKDANAFNLLNSNPLYSKYAIANSSSAIMTMNKHYNSFTRYADLTNSRSIQKRMSFFENLNKFKVNISVPGRTDYTVGQVVELNVPRVTQIVAEDSDFKDKMISGRYLITAISHSIDRERHTCNLEIVKNSTLLNLSTM